MNKFDVYIDFIKIHFSGEYDENKCNNEYINNKLFKYKNIKDDDIVIKIGKKISLIFKNNYINKYDDIELLYDDDDVKIQYNENHADANIIFKYKDIHEIQLLTCDYKIIELCDDIIKNEEYKGKCIITDGIKFLLKFLKNAKYIKLHGKLSSLNNINRLKNFYENNIEYIFCEKNKKICENKKIYFENDKNTKNK